MVLLTMTDDERIAAAFGLSADQVALAGKSPAQSVVPSWPAARVPVSDRRTLALGELPVPKATAKPKAKKPKAKRRKRFRPSRSEEIAVIVRKSDCADLVDVKGTLTVDYDAADLPKVITFDPWDEGVENSMSKVVSWMGTASTFAVRDDEGCMWLFEVSDWYERECADDEDDDEDEDEREDWDEDE